MADSENQSFGALRRFSVGALIVLALGTGLTWWAGFNLRSLAPPSKTQQSVSAQDPAIYGLGADGQLVPQKINLPAGLTPEAALQNRLVALLNPPPGFASAVPTQTKLLGARLTPQGIEVNLSPEFTGGGGSSSQIARLGQILYTATQSDPDAALWLQVAGQPLDALGGEGLMVDQPLTRRSFAETFELTAP
jgi:spore germination protein GerM